MLQVHKNTEMFIAACPIPKVTVILGSTTPRAGTFWGAKITSLEINVDPGPCSH